MSIRNRLSLIRQVWVAFGEDNGALLAAAVSFYSFLSLFPLLLVVAGVLGFVLGSPQHAEAVLTRMVGSFAVSRQTMAVVQEVIHGRSVATGIGLVVLLWSGTSALVVLEQAMNLAWRTTERRSYLKRRGIALLMLLVVGLLMVLSLGITTLIHAIAASNSPIASKLNLFWRLLAYPVPALASIILFALIYKVLPHARVTWRVALVGGLFAGVLWEIAKHVFAYYVLHWPSNNQVYGSLSSVILTMVWINYTSFITILGAEFASAWAKRRELRIRVER